MVNQRRRIFAIGTAIGQFVGGIVGGIAQGMTSSLPAIGTDLSNFMMNIQPFINGASMIDSSTLDGVKSLVGVILALTGANILESLTSWLTGGSSLTKFGEDLAAFGPNMKAYADSISGIDASAVEASANAARALSQLAANLPNSGGLVSWFAGENDISTFGDQLIPFGEGLKRYSESVAGIDAQAVSDSAIAAKALAEMASTVPNEGGMVAWFTGENSIAKFGNELVALGTSLYSFAASTAGIDPSSVTAVAAAAEVLAEMTSVIPNEGGVVSWFAGENSISKFSSELIELGVGIRGFAMTTAGVEPDSMIAAATAAKALAEMTSYIPNEGGVVSWFTGENSVSKFSDDLVTLGHGLRGFAYAVTGIESEQVMGAANAAKALAEMTTYIPNEGGVVSWFTGDNSLSKFSGDLGTLGVGLKAFSDSIIGIDPESVTAAANSAKALAEMSTYIPNEGGMVAWFTGENSVATFASQLPILGMGLRSFSDAITGIVPENVSAAANAAKALAEMTAVIPNEGGVVAWFTGENSVSKFASHLPDLGHGLKSFSDSVTGINPDNVTAAASAAKSLGEMTSVIPSDTSKVKTFGTNIVAFGDSLRTYFVKTLGITDSYISISNKAIESVKQLTTLDAGNISSAAKAIDSAVESITKMSRIPRDCAKEFSKALDELGKTSAGTITEAFDDIETNLKKIGQTAIESFIKGIKDKTSSAKKACTTLASDCAGAISDNTAPFVSAGRDVVIGFANGISENTFRAVAKATAMAKAAAKAAEEALDINSPSKVFMRIGGSVPEGFALGIDKMTTLVSSSSDSMADAAVASVNNTISNIADIIDSDIDSEPTIRPVIDLSSVRSSAKSIGGMFGEASVGVWANLGAISSMMNTRSQNGVNDELISEFKKLRRDVSNLEHATYNINGVTYDDGSNISDAVGTLVRAARVERRK